MTLEYKPDGTPIRPKTSDFPNDKIGYAAAMLEFDQANSQAKQAKGDTSVTFPSGPKYDAPAGADLGVWGTLTDATQASGIPGTSAPPGGSRDNLPKPVTPAADATVPGVPAQGGPTHKVKPWDGDPANVPQDQRPSWYVNDYQSNGGENWGGGDLETDHPDWWGEVKDFDPAIRDKMKETYTAHDEKGFNQLKLAGREGKYGLDANGPDPMAATGGPYGTGKGGQSAGSGADNLVDNNIDGPDWGKIIPGLSKASMDALKRMLAGA